MTRFLNILFITPSYKPAYVYGGPTVSVSALAEALVATGHRVTVYTTTANGSKELEVETGVAQQVNGVTVIYFRRITGDHTHISPALWKSLDANAESFDIIHLHSWWSILIMRAAWICRKKQISFILSPRGMLGAYSFTHQHSFSKKWIHKIAGKNLLASSILHATTRLEWDDCRKVNAGWKGFILPNLIELPVLKNGNEHRDENTVLTIGFLSRVDPKKGLELLFQALADVKFDFRLRIAGSGEPAYLMRCNSYPKRFASVTRCNGVAGWRAMRNSGSWNNWIYLCLRRIMKTLPLR